MNQHSEDEAVSYIDRRTALVSGLVFASLISSSRVFAHEADAGSAEARPRQIGIELRKIAAPVAICAPAARIGSLNFLAGSRWHSAARAGWT
jgi:hypothetical protein